MFGKKKLENLSVEELEQTLLIKKRQARLERFQRRTGQARSTNEALLGPEWSSAKEAARSTQQGKQSLPERPKNLRDSLLLGLEVTAVLGLVAVLIASYFNLRELNDEVAVAQQTILTETSTLAEAETAPPAPIALARLPGGHTPPTAPGGAVPDVPLHLQEWVQPEASFAAAAASVEVEHQESAGPTRIVIPKIKVDAPIVSGVTWEDLKKGVGHLPGSAYPGQRGNLYLAAHNDIYGEIFRYLSELEVGDEYFIYGGEQKFRYIVTEKRIIDPTEVEVMLPSTEPISTLQTCYPYLVDTHRLIVIGKLAG